MISPNFMQYDCQKIITSSCLMITLSETWSNDLDPVSLCSFDGLYYFSLLVETLSTLVRSVFVYSLWSFYVSFHFFSHILLWLVLVSFSFVISSVFHLASLVLRVVFGSFTFGLFWFDIHIYTIINKSLRFPCNFTTLNLKTRQ